MMHSKKFRIHPTSVEGYAFLLLSILLAVYSLVLHVESQAKWKMSPYLFPLVIATFLFLLSLSLLQEGGRAARTEKALTKEERAEFSQPVAEEKHVLQSTRIGSLFGIFWQKSWKDSVLFACMTLLYILSIGFVGFLLSTVLFLVFTFVYLKERRPYLVIVLSIGFPLVAYVLFGMVLHVMLP